MMKLRTRIALLTGLMLTVATALFGYVTFRVQEDALLSGLDAKLLATATLAKEILPADYHDRITGPDSMSQADYLTVVDRWNRLCTEMGLEYIWSLMLLDGTTVFTSGSSTSKDVRNGDHALFLEPHTNPELYAKAFATMEPQYQTSDDKWGRIRAVLLPFRDVHGRPCLFGASMKAADVRRLTRMTALRSAEVSAAIVLIGLWLSALVAASLVRPLEKLTGLARGITTGDWGRAVEPSGTAETRSLTQSVNLMSQSIRQKIDELEQAGAALRTSEERYQLSAEATSDGLWDWDVAAGEGYFSPAYYTMLGYEVGAFAPNASAWEALLHPDDRDSALRANAECIEGRTERFQVEFRMRAADGGWHWILGRGKCITRDEDGRACRIVGTHVDITERKRAEEALRESEARFRSLFEEMAQGVVYHDAEGRITNANPAAERILGVTLEQMRETTPVHRQWRCVHEDLSEFPGDEHPAPVAIRTGREVRDVVIGVYHALEDQWRWILVSAVPELPPEGGRPCGAFATFTDITERKRADEALRRSQAELQAMFDSVPAGIWYVDLEGNCVRVNEAGAALVGLSRADIEGRNVAELLRGESDTSFQDDLEAVRAGRPQSGLTREIVTPGGQRRLVRVDRAPALDARGDVVGVTEFMVDITDSVLREQEQRVSETRLQALLGLYEMSTATERQIADYSLTAGIALTRSAMGFLGFMNADETECTIHAWSSEAMEECEVEDCTLLFHTEETGLWGDVVRHRAPVIINDYSAPHPSKKGVPAGHVSVVRYLGIPVISEGLVVAVAGFANKVSDYDETDVRQATVLLNDMWQHITSRRDRKERQALEAQLQQTQRLESLGVLAGGIAHDFNNVLAGIHGFTEMALEEAEPGCAVTQYLEHALSGVTRATELVRQILSFSRQAPMDERPVLLHALTRDVLRFARATLPATVEIQQYLDTDTPPIQGDPTQVHQVILNLCTNADHAMRLKGGVLRVAVEPVEVGRGEAALLGLGAPGWYALLTVSDTGCGMDPATRERLFEPFFTTKPVGEGTGMGLATSHGIVARHHGAITVESQVGVGTTFRVYFPAIPGLREQETEREDGEAPRGTERVLVVDDEPRVLSAAEGRLRSLGYTPTAAGDGEQALELFRADPTAFDLILTDQTMPRVTGLDLAARIRRIDADIPIVLSTGFSESATPEALATLGIEEVLTKPCSKRQMAEALRRVLDARPAPE